ncbi:MAG: bifunctional nuclease family protein [Coriobacteriia bacterium]|nr:bifunctional nuclease family protein [Coriobacteriia bacterium]
MLPLEVNSLGLDPRTQTPVVLLSVMGDASVFVDRVMPMNIGGAEASALLAGLRRARPARPGTHDLLAAIIQRSGFQLLRVEIYDFAEQAFLARLVFDINGVQNTLEARPSDAMALAARLETPVLVDEHVFMEYSMPKHAVHVHEGPSSAPSDAPVTVPDGLKDQVRGLYEQLVDARGDSGGCLNCEEACDGGFDEDEFDIDDSEFVEAITDMLGMIAETFQQRTGAAGVGVDMRVMGMVPRFQQPQEAPQKREVSEDDVQEFRSFMDNVLPEDF